MTPEELEKIDFQMATTGSIAGGDVHRLTDTIRALWKERESQERRYKALADAASELRDALLGTDDELLDQDNIRALMAAVYKALPTTNKTGRWCKACEGTGATGGAVSCAECGGRGYLPTTDKKRWDEQLIEDQKEAGKQIAEDSMKYKWTERDSDK
jgi:RecJ-like exonuclease